jgi:hypothetical protein
MPDINQSYQWAINTCNADNVGYSQTYRNQQTIDGVTYYDCSSFIWYALLAGGFDCKGVQGSSYPMTTHNERAVLTGLGFKSVDITAEWLPGDILWRTGHTEMVYSGGEGVGVTMGAHTGRYSLANQVSINTNQSSSGSWSELYRYGDGAEGYGISIDVVAAICGNWYIESTINPGIWENLTEDSPGYGLGQWTNNSESTRRTELFSYLSSNGYSQDDGYGQLNFFMKENIWYQNGYGENYESLTDFLNSTSTDLEELTYSFMQGWEGIWNGTQTTRYENAVKIRDYLRDNANDTSITEFTKGNRYLTQTEAFKNAVLIYRYLSDFSGGYPGGGGGTASSKHKMPVWMMTNRKRRTVIR